MKLKDKKDIDNVDIEKVSDEESTETEKKERNRRRLMIGTILTLIVIIIILLLRSCGKEEAPTNSHAVTIDTSAEDKKEQVHEDPLAGRDVYFSGIVDSNISKTGSIQLLNDERNDDFFMKFIVIDTKNTDTEEDDETIYESNLVPSGKAIYWVPGEVLESGTYKLNFKEVPYFFPDGDPETNPNSYITLSVGNNVVEITIL